MQIDLLLIKIGFSKLLFTKKMKVFSRKSPRIWTVDLEAVTHQGSIGTLSEVRICGVS